MNNLRHPWIVNLSAVIGEYYCCKAFRRSEYGKQTLEVGFVGLEDDIEVCLDIFAYAVDCSLSGAKQLEARYKSLSYPTSFLRKIQNGYGYGFEAGLEAKLKAQQNENKDEWGLILQIPKEVHEAFPDMGTALYNPKAQSEFSNSAFLEGYRDGQEFDPSTKLKGGTEE